MARCLPSAIAAAICKSARTEGAEGCECWFGERHFRLGTQTHILHHEVFGRRVGVRENMENTWFAHIIYAWLPGYVSHCRINCITTSVKGKETTPLHSLCRNRSFTIASYASTSCNSNHS